MNFKDMWELAPIGGPDYQYMVDAGYVEPLIKLPLTGYRMFWTIIVVVVSSMLLTMWRGGLFRALQ